MIRKTKILITGAILLLSFGGYWLFFRPSSATATLSTPIRVTTGSISTTIKSTGKISPLQTSILHFAKQGTVSKIYKKVGEAVKAGDLIAEIDATSAYKDIESARLNVSNAKNNYDKLFASMSASDKIRAENTYTESKATLSLLQSQYDNLMIADTDTLTETEADLRLMADKVTLAENELKYAEQNITTDTTSNNIERDVANGYSLLESSYQTLSPSLKTISDTLLLENKSNPTYGAIGEKDPTLKLQVETLYDQVKKSTVTIETIMDEVRAHPASLTSVLSGLTEMKKLINDLSTLATLSVSTLRASQTGPDLESTFLDSRVATLETLSSSLASKSSSVNTSLANLKNYGNDDLVALSNKNTITAKEQALTSIKNDLAKAKANYELLKKSQENEKNTKKQEITKQENTIKLNQALYEELIQGPENTDLISAKNSIASAQISLEKTNLALRDYQIIAAFDGVVNDIPWIIGDTTASTEGILVENKGAYEIKLSLDQIDIVKLHEGMKANIILDAFPNQTYTGTVSTISAVPTETSGVVSYEATILLSLDRSDIYSKMSATVEVITTEKDDIILIPSSAIITENGKSYVNKATDPASIPNMMFATRTRDIQGSTGTLSGEFRRGSMGTGSTGSGGLRSFSGGMRGGSGSRMRGGSGSTAGSAASNISIPTEKVEIMIGISSNGKTEVISGLEIGDIIVTTRSSAAKPATKATGTTTTRGGQGGFGGPPPGF